MNGWKDGWLAHPGGCFWCALPPLITRPCSPPIIGVVVPFKPFPTQVGKGVCYLTVWTELKQSEKRSTNHRWHLTRKGQKFWEIHKVEKVGEEKAIEVRKWVWGHNWMVDGWMGSFIHHVEFVE